MSKKSTKRNPKSTKNKTVQATLIDNDTITQAPSDTPAEEESAYVTYEFGRTINVGNMEMLKFRIGLTVPCTKKNINKMYEKAAKFVEMKMEEKLKEWGVQDQ